MIKNFPSQYEPYPEQIEVINKIEKALETKKFIICCAPTGSGKSMVAKTFANSSEGPCTKYRSLIENNSAFELDINGEFYAAPEMNKLEPFGAMALTITKSLQNQYKSMFDDSEVLQGKSNYICTYDERFDVESAPCVFLNNIKGHCITNKTCHYYNARRDTLLNKMGVLNYSMFMSLPDHVKKRQYIICDEASELEGELVKRFSFEFNYKKLKFLGLRADMPLSSDGFYGWLVDFTVDVGEAALRLKQKLAKKSKTITITDRQKYVSLRSMHLSLQKIIDSWKKCDYVIEQKREGVTLVPLKVDNLANELFKCGEKIILMSATIIDHASFAKSLGIHDYEYIEIGSKFDPKKSPIYVSNKVRLNYKNLRSSLPWVAEQVQKICDHHKEHKGIIHTHTMEITEYLQSILKGDRFLFRERGINNEMILQDHIDSPDPTVLISPSLTHGVDLKGNLAKFQIVVKAAYLPLGDKRVKKLFDEDKEWYTNQMLSTFVQSCGRAIRSVEDEAVTYVLDGTIYDAIIKNTHKFPRFFLQRIKG